MDNAATTAPAAPFTFEQLAEQIAEIAERHGVDFDADLERVRFTAHYSRRAPNWEAATAATLAARRDLVAVLRAEHPAAVPGVRLTYGKGRAHAWGLYFDGERRPCGAATGLHLADRHPRPDAWRAVGETTPRGFRRATQRAMRRA